MSAAVGLGAAAGAFVVSFALTPLCARFARRIGLVDRPGPLKPQARTTPYLGGIGVGCGTAVGAALLSPWLLVPLVMALALGTADDARPLHPALRLAGEVATGLVLAAVVSTRFADAAAFVLVTLSTVALINGFNMLDGLDGLCGSVTVVGAAGFAVLLGGDARALALSLAGATAAFVVFNRPPARVYLGDGGAYVIGVSMAALLARAWAPSATLSTGLGSLAIVVLPLAEVGLAVLRRRWSRRPLMAGDRDHPYDLLVRRGWGTVRTVAAYAVTELLLVGAALLASHLGAQGALVVLAVAVLGITVAGLEAGFACPGTTRSTDEVAT
jgi:UDP-GlcNAc:undecaprenyl-phosphate/decaprenyl-phosphate GlcNAc-1-phosphate transferase